MARLLFIFVVALMLGGCFNQEKRVDATSDEKMKESIADVRKSLPKEQQGRFDDALKVIAFSQLDLKSLIAGGERAVDLTKDTVKKNIDGKNAQEVIAVSERILAERREKERRQALLEVEEFEAKKVKAESNEKELEKFKVLRSRFYKREKSYSSRTEPIIELTIQNNTLHAVSRAYFRGTIASKGRSVPWLVKEFNYEISGGVEPGEKKEWTLAPNMFSKWGKVEAPDDAVFTVEVVKLDGSDGETLFSSIGLTEYEEKKLSEYKKKYMGR